MTSFEYCYEKSAKENAICKPAYLSNEQSILVSIWFVIICAIIWLAFVVLDIMDVILNPRFVKRLVDNQSIRSDNKSLAHLLALVLLSAPLALFYSPNFQIESFCTMNKQAGICQNKWNQLGKKIDCIMLGSHCTNHYSLSDRFDCHEHPSLTAFVDTVGGNLTVGPDVIDFID